MSVLKKLDKEKRLLWEIYTRLYVTFGSRNWWPADSVEEVIIGAILTQNITWNNVEQAIALLKAHKKLSFRSIAETDDQELAKLIRPARFLNQKAKALKVFADYLGREYGYCIRRMSRKDTHVLRNELLDLYRIGPETADSILLYALKKPIFVIDVYTKRICSRHGILKMEDSYENFQKYFMENLPTDTQMYNEYHALLVYTGNQLCKPKPLCSNCPLHNL